MNWVALIVLITAIEGFVIENTRNKREVDELPQPILISLTAFDPPGFKLEWDPVKTGDGNEDILGYKVKVWELITKSYKYVTKDGKRVLIEEEKEIDLPLNKIPEGPPARTVEIQGADKTEAVVKNIKENVSYEMRVSVFTKTSEGPLSLPMRIKLLN